MELEYRDGHFVDPQKQTSRHSRITRNRVLVGGLATILTVAGAGLLDKCSAQNPQNGNKPSPSIGLVSTPGTETPSPIPSLIATAETASPIGSESAEMGSF